VCIRADEWPSSYEHCASVNSIVPAFLDDLSAVMRKTRA
jgi:hypothetical protein